MTMERVQTLKRNETKLIGYTVTASVNQDLEKRIIERLRDELISKRHEISNRLDNDGMYLVQIYEDCEWTPDAPFESIVAVEVSNFDQIPDGFIRHTIPAGKYVKVTHKGPESSIGETYDAIRENGIEHTRPFDFEYWADINSLDQEENMIDIFLPLQD
ncbi:GyrI-like domain-containing protein [Bacillus sp. JJ722]|uniref:GyrI-like domain-containing protein n=1 Tax=Bacillus sp. JJ722 TaxID=3122973 RepID=UPI002FFFF2FE